MSELKRELAIRILKENACMFNSCLTKDELKHFRDFDFVQYLINRLSMPKHNCDNCHNAGCRRKNIEDGYIDGYNKAIDEFTEALRLECLDSCYKEVHLYTILKMKDKMKEQVNDE